MSKTKHVFEDKSFKKPTPCDLCNVCYLLFSNKKRKPKKIFLFFSKITFFCRFKPYLNSFTNLIVHLSFVFCTCFWFGFVLGCYLGLWQKQKMCELQKMFSQKMYCYEAGTLSWQSSESSSMFSIHFMCVWWLKIIC